MQPNRSLNRPWFARRWVPGTSRKDVESVPRGVRATRSDYKAVRRRPRVKAFAKRRPNPGQHAQVALTGEQTQNRGRGGWFGQHPPVHIDLAGLRQRRGTGQNDLMQRPGRTRAARKRAWQTETMEFLVADVFLDDSRPTWRFAASRDAPARRSAAKRAIARIVAELRPHRAEPCQNPTNHSRLGAVAGARVSDGLDRQAARGFLDLPSGLPSEAMAWQYLNT